MALLVSCAPGSGIGDSDAGTDGWVDAWDNEGPAESGDNGEGSADTGDFDPWADWDESPACLQWEDLAGRQLREALLQATKDHHALSYDGAREEMFAFVDNQDGRVQGVYTGAWVTTNGVPDANTMNTEHTWCQSWGADTTPAKSDLNHLFPTISSANSVRSNLPFGWVLEPTWSEGGSKKGLDGWGNVVFEPRDAHKGDAARAIFYFAVRYQMPVPDLMEDVLRQWNRLDPPDDKEVRRTDRIEQLQQRRNPFVDCPYLVERIEDF